MRGLIVIWTVLVITIALLVAGCFPSKEAVSLDPHTISSASKIEAPTKAFLKDASVLLLPDGFRISGDTLVGRGDRHWIDHYVLASDFRVPLDSVATMTYYENTSSAGSVWASANLGVFGSIYTPLSLYCVTCAKCCFGSCPTVYTTSEDGEYYGLEAELFSYSLSRYYQEEDLDRLAQPLKPDGTYQLKLTNEALETHYINRFNLLAAQHPPGTRVYPAPDGTVLAIRSEHPPAGAGDYKGRNVLSLIRDRDNRWFRSDTTRLEQMTSISEKDWMELKLRTPSRTDSITVVVRLRNTLLTTILFYDVVLASQGVDALDWTQQMNSDSLYASIYHTISKHYAGMSVKVKEAESWTKAATISDVGPIAWKEVAVRLPVKTNGSGEMAVRLEWFPDNFMIDYIGVDYASTTEPVFIDTIPPDSIRDYRGEDAARIWLDIAEADAKFLVTEPGESYYFDYSVAPGSSHSTTLFLRSKGYYTEWLRGDWITAGDSGYRFDIFNVEETVRRLKESWVENRTLLEQTFFETKIPLKEEL